MSTMAHRGADGLAPLVARSGGVGPARRRAAELAVRGGWRTGAMAQVHWRGWCCQRAGALARAFGQALLGAQPAPSGAPPPPRVRMAPGKPR